MVDSHIEFYMVNFFHLVMMNQFWNVNICSEVNFIRSMIESMHPTRRTDELKQRKLWMEETNDVWERTCKEINTRLPFVEIAYNKNVMKGFNKTIEVMDNDGEYFDYSTAKLYNYLKQAESRLVRIATAIAAFYKMPIPLQQNRGLPGISGGSLPGMAGGTFAVKPSGEM